MSARDLDILFGGRGVDHSGMGVSPQLDGSLIVWNTESTTSVVHAFPTGEIRPVRRGPYGAMRSDGDGVIFRAYDGASAVGTGDPVLFSFETFSVASGERIAIADAFPLPSVCNGVGPHSPQISNGRFLSIRGTCVIGDMRYIVERWEDHDGVLEVVAGPYDMDDPMASATLNRSTFADGRGGLFMLGIPRTREPERVDRRVVVTHWNGDDAPARSEQLGPTGATTDFGRGVIYGDGTFGVAANYEIDGELTTLVARVDRDARILWTWQSPPGFTAGPNHPAIATVGIHDLIVVLVRPRELRTVYVMRLDPLGRQRWSEPRALPWPGRTDIELTLVVGHPSGTFHVAWFPGSLGWFDAEAAPLWEEPIPRWESDFSRAQLFADGDEGVWFTDTGFMGGALGHWDRNQWSLFRRWGYDGCGQRRGIVTRAGPDAEARTWWGPFPFGNAP
ncbi:MAG: hypothetical protein J0L92_30880 [Deltaproteobacteria bacterium]|nr:hypothetical protein [Deltaproteobacteria bacterium]